jgi:hypothetical protein
MQRFRLMKIYVGLVLLVLGLAIARVSSPEPSSSDAASADTDPLPDSAGATQPADDNVADHANVAQPPVGQRIHDSTE